MTDFDLHLGAHRLAALITGTTDDDLARPTPFSLWHETIVEAFDFTLAVSFPHRERANA